MRAPSGRKRTIQAVLPIVLAALLTTVVPAAANAGRAGAVEATTTLFTCWITPLGVTETGGPSTDPDHQRCQTDRTAISQADGSAGPLEASAIEVSGSTSVLTGPVQAATADTASGGAAGAASFDAAGIGVAGIEAAAVTRTESAIAKASAASARFVVGGTVVDVGAVTTETKITCSYSASGATYAFSSRSTVAGVKIDGRRVRLHNGPMSIPVAGSASLTINYSKVSAFGSTQRAAMLHAAGADAVLGEAAVAITTVASNPCRV